MDRRTKKSNQNKASTFSKEAVQNRLDLSAEYFEREGHHDLAAKVDYYCAKLDGCGPDGFSLIKRALARVLEEGRSRIPKVKGAVQQPSQRVEKARAATRKVRRSPTTKKAAIKRRLKAIAAKRKKAKDMLESFRESRKARLRKRSENLKRSRK